ncbi:MAG: hypothetical protein KA419_02535 [Acidobacteria bacterium]|nr:hypothetical protein [Acidobacteriota bacterium]
MRILMSWVLAVLLCAGCSGPAGEAEKASGKPAGAAPGAPAASAPAGENRFGVAVYPGATYDAEASKAFSRTFGGEFHCYRTGDGLGKVTEFFKANTSLTPDGIGDKDARFLHRTDPFVRVMVRSPWQDTSGGKHDDTLVQICREGPEEGM